MPEFVCLLSSFIGFLFVCFLFEGKKFAAPPVAVAFVAFCFAVAVGIAWEVFEFGMDQIFGLNMHKSGLVDTMTDLIVDTVEAAVGFFSLKGRQFRGLSGLIAEILRLDRRFFAKLRDR